LAVYRSHDLSEVKILVRKKALAEHAAGADVRTFGKPEELEQYLSSFEAPRPKAVR
jgi:hypothetical protein